MASTTSEQDGASAGREDEEEPVFGLTPQEQGQSRWLSMSQLRVAVSKLRKDLDELQSPSPVLPEGRELTIQDEDATPKLYRMHRSVGSVGSGPLAYYHRGVAVRMLRDYLQDLVVLNDRQLEDVPEDLRQKRISTVQKRIEEYQTALREMEELNSREPDGVLKWQERDMLKRMLEDYSSGLEEFLDSPDDLGGKDNIEEELAVVRDRIDLVMVAMPLDFSGTRFDVMTESLAASLEGCELQVLEFSQLQCQGFEVFKLQCDFVVETLSPSTKERLQGYKNFLEKVKSLEVKDYEVGRRQRIFRSVAFCIESLAELARQFQAVVDLLTRCCIEKWWITALELSNAPPKFSIPRWSTFSLAIRACEWSMDIVELAFHALGQLLIGESTLLDVVFKWSQEQNRMVLEIDGKPVHRQEARVGKAGLLAVSRDLESKDVETLIQRLVEVSEKRPKGLFADIFDNSDANMHGITSFLSQKLNGPVPSANSLPWTFDIPFSTLKFSYFIDAGASGMVAEYRWFGQKLAVKTVKSPGLSRKKFQEEAAILATVQHPFVVRMVGCAFESKIESGFLAMERMEHDLHSVIVKQCPKPGPGVSPFPLIVAIDIMMQISEGMQYLQAHNILHRDLKAKNVLLNRCRRVRRSLSAAYRRFPDLASLLHTEDYYTAKLADFGIAKDRINSSMTMMVGTTPWRAPEVFNAPDLETAHYYTWHADVYSFAMTCFEILTGRLPFEGVRNGQIYESIIAGDRPSLDDVDMSPALRDLIQRCWATIPTDRPSFTEIYHTLWQCKVENILSIFRLQISPSRSPSL